MLEIDGAILLQLVVNQARASTLDQVLVVLGANAEAILGRLDLGRAGLVINPRHEQGMSTSLLAGMAALGDGVDSMMVILGDQPGLGVDRINDLLSLHHSSGLPLAALGFGELLHPPVVISRHLWGELADLEGDIGCRQLVRGHREEVAVLRMETDARHPIDIDTPEDFQRLLSGSG